jgi:flagellar basal body-associated protein FliL
VDKVLTLRDRFGKAPIVLILIVVVVLCLGVTAFAVLKMGKGSGKAAKVHADVSAWKLDEFVVNLADPEPRYLKATLVLEIEGQVQPKAEGDNPNMDEVRAKDTIIGVMSKKRYSDLVIASGKEELKDELKAALNPAMREYNIKVDKIDFTSFQMQ